MPTQPTKTRVSTSVQLYVAVGTVLGLAVAFGTGFLLGGAASKKGSTTANSTTSCITGTDTYSYLVKRFVPPNQVTCDAYGNVVQSGHETTLSDLVPTESTSTQEGVRSHAKKFYTGLGVSEDWVDALLGPDYIDTLAPWLNSRRGSLQQMLEGFLTEYLEPMDATEGRALIANAEELETAFREYVLSRQLDLTLAPGAARARVLGAAVERGSEVSPRIALLNQGFYQNSNRSVGTGFPWQQDRFHWMIGGRMQIEQVNGDWTDLHLRSYEVRIGVSFNW